MSQNNENIEVMKDIRNRLDAVLNKEEFNGTKSKEKHPDALWHLRISMAKSLVRIVAGGVLCTGELFLAGSLLILAEVLGIVEELV